MNVIKVTIPKECDKITVKAFVRSYLGISSRVFIKQKYLENGMMINGKRCRSTDVLNIGDVFSLTIAEDNTDYEPAAIPIDIIYEDNNYIVINKPPSMTVHPSPGHNRDSLLNAVAYHYKKQGTSMAFKPLYRLDKDTSGILVAAKNRLAVSSAILEKKYYAVCEGSLLASGTINMPIKRCDDSKIKREVGGDIHSVTHWKALKTDNRHTLLEISLETGRTHQIRVHFAHTLHPLAGDDLYGGGLNKIERQALYLGFVHLKCDILGVDKQFCIPVPNDILNAFPKLFKSEG